MALTESTLKNAKPAEKAYKLADGLGMFLLIKPNGSRLWRLKYRFAGKEKLLALGSYPEVSLKRAREHRDAARQLLKEGKDPAMERKTARRAVKLNAENAFEQVAREFVQQQKARWSKAHAADVLHRLEIYIFPDLGSRPIANISALELLDVIRKLEARGATDLSHRMLQTCGQVFRYGVVTGRCAKDVAADLRGALVPHVQKHQPSIPPTELPELLTAIQGYDGDAVSRLGLQFLALTFVRTAELIGATWPEFDEGGGLWVIPAARMKMKREHLVPLSRQTLALLTQLRNLNGDARFVFAGANPRKHISNNTLLYALYRLGYHSRMTGHGFRALASTILNEERERGSHSFGPDVVERQLAHQERNKVRGAYNRAEYLRERSAMMAWWADYLDQQAGGVFVDVGSQHAGSLNSPRSRPVT
jgi:integrase